MKQRYPLSLLAMLTLLCAGCQTTGPNEQTTTPADTKSMTFVPAGQVARLQMGDGQYPTLFSATSTAIWVQPVMGPVASDGEEATQSTDTVSAMTQHFHVFECSLESMFADRSIAYDAVGLRGVQIHLETPDGKRFPPTQTMMGRDLAESAQGALKIYGRTVLLAFAKDAVPLTGQGTVRLVLEGHNTTFYFEWLPQPQMVSIKQEKRQERVSKVKQGVNRGLEKGKNVSHRFD